MSDDAYEVRERDSLNEDRWHERQDRAALLRTPEAQADIAAARAAPTTMERWAEAVDANLAEVDKHQVHGAQVPDLDAALSNAALADTPAVREMGDALHPHEQDAVAGSIRAWRRPGGNIGIDTTHAGSLIRDTGTGPHIVIERADLDDAIAALQVLAGTPPRQPDPALRPEHLPPGAVLLTGPEAERYRALQAAARHAQESARAAQAAGAVLRDAFQTFCAATSPAKEP